MSDLEKQMSLACGEDRMTEVIRGHGVESELIRRLNAATGLCIASLRRVPVKSHAVNLRAVGADGSLCLVKVVSARVRLPTVNHPLAPRDLFPDRELTFAGRRVYVMEWKRGVSKTLDSLTDGELADLVATHASFCRTLGGGLIHGDYNCRNILFDAGRVSAILDLEAIRAGSPCEDFVRYALTSAEHLPLFAFVRRRRVARNFVKLAEAVGASVDAWRRAIEEHAERKAARKRRPGKNPLWRLNLAWRRRFYRGLMSRLETNHE